MEEKDVLKQEIEFSLFIPLIVSSLVEMLLSIALIRCKKDSFLVEELRSL